MSYNGPPPKGMQKPGPPSPPPPPARHIPKRSDEPKKTEEATDWSWLAWVALLWL